MKKKINKKLKISIIVVAAIIAISVVLKIVKTSISAKSQSSSTYTVKSETYENSIEIAGTISAAEEQTLQALSDGTVLAVYVEKGDKVKKGDIIIQLDSTEQEYNLAKLEYDMDSSKITGAKKQLQLQEIQKKSLLQKIEDRKVVATFDGIIADLDVNVGDSMEAKDSVGTLVNVDYLKADVEIAETDVSKLKVGQKVEFNFPAYDGTVYGYVVGWPAIGEVTTRGATVVNAEVRIDDYPEEILPNFSFTGKIQITEPVDNLIVESAAIGHEMKREKQDESNNDEIKPSEPENETENTNSKVNESSGTNENTNNENTKTENAMRNPPPNDTTFVQLASSDEKIYVRVQPYGQGYVKIVEGNVKEGDVLKAQSKPKISGQNRTMNQQNNKNSDKNQNSRNNPMGGGPGGPPPGF